MTRHVIGIDPGSGELGYTWTRPTGAEPPEVLELDFLRTEGEERTTEGIHFLFRLGRRVEQAGATSVLWAVEAAPPKLKKGQHGSHISGAGPERWRTVARVAALMLGHEFVQVGISPWRRTMAALDRRWSGRRRGRPTPRPRGRCKVAGTKRIPGAMVRVTFECGHRDDWMSAALLDGHQPACPACSRMPAGATPSDLTTDEHKRAACDWVALHWPDHFERLVEGPRKRAKTRKPDHRLTGVPDACEALGVACHAMTMETR